jgi:hypothetical protein
MIRRSIAPPTGAENHGAYTLTVKGTRGGVSTRGPASTSSNTASSFWSADGPGAPLQEKHSCTSPDVDVPATGGLLAPRTNTLLPPRFFARTNQFAGRWHGKACGGLTPRLALLRSLSHSFAASQSNAPAIAQKTFCHAGWPCTLFAFRLPRHVVHAVHSELAAHIAHAAQVASMVPMHPCRCTNRCKLIFVAGQTQSLLRRSSHSRTRLAGCVHRSAHGEFQLGVASVVHSGRVGRHALFHCAGAQIAVRSGRVGRHTLFHCHAILFFQCSCAVPP